MKKRLLVSGIIVLLALLVPFGIIVWHKVQLSRQLKQLGKWESAPWRQDKPLPWIHFDWVGDTIGNKWVAHAAMFVPVNLENIAQPLRCQFDIGSDLSLLYGNPVDALSKKYPSLSGRINSIPDTRDTLSYLKDITLFLDRQRFSSACVFLRRHYGGEVVADSIRPADTLQIGTIGVDVCYNRVLVIDYPHQQLCILDTVPDMYPASYSSITLDNRGRPVLPMRYNGKEYKVAFDCGSSMFAILARQQVIGSFSAAPPADTIDISSWGKMVTMIGRPMKDTFTLAGIPFSNIMVYTSREPGMENIQEGCDAITGNVLFEHKILIIDFRNKKMAVY